MLGYFNRTHSMIDGSWAAYEFFFILEVALIVFSIFYIFLWFSIICTAKNTHRNSRVISAFCYGQYILQLSFWGIQPILLLSNSLDDNNKSANELFNFCTTCRTIGLFYGLSGVSAKFQTGFSAFFFLPALVIERSFATFLVRDYERKTNAAIGNILVLIQMSLAIGLGLHFNSVHTKNTVPHTVGAIIVNFVAVVVNRLNEYINSKYYHQMGQVAYSLSERFQITENIRTAQMFNKIVYSIWIFNVIVNIYLILDSYDYPIGYRNLAAILCDYSILTYGLIVPVVTYIQTDSWQRRLQVMLNSCCNPKVQPLKSTFGHDMHSRDAGEEATKYFEMLKTQWK